jgi:hypothetical protein
VSSTYVSADLRRLVVARAESLCEYCLVHADDAFFGCEVDHVVSEKHGGLTTADNLAFACLPCNRRKGSDIGSVAEGTGALTRFYNPRTDVWLEHFSYDEDGSVIRPLSEIGEVTARIFGFNQPEQVLERESLRTGGRYPVPAALKRMRALD